MAVTKSGRETERKRERERERERNSRYEDESPLFSAGKGGDP